MIDKHAYDPGGPLPLCAHKEGGTICGRPESSPRQWRVGCYREDLTEARAAVIARTNAVLAGARAMFVALDVALS